MKTTNFSTILVIIIALLLVFVLLPSFSGFGMMGMMNSMMPGIGFMSLIGFFFIIAIVYMIYWLFKDGFDQKKPIDILKERYAKGELSETEFKKMRKKLE